ncbi:MAG: DUF3369 domain-containing protein [Rhodoferax sp.]|nr:DUF3369 domain-containing protein [Rhodoferax sp.]
MAETEDDDMNWLVEDEPAPVIHRRENRPWRLLIVDDEADIHTVTRLALSKVTYKDRGLEILSAYSGAQGYEMLASEQDIALVLLDVVMESEDAGLRLARRIREELQNHLVRIVLRTGQPGQAPEQRVIVEFDINDYKGKTELTSQKLFTSVITSLRNYEGLLTIEKSRQGLTKILKATSDLYHIESLKELASGVLTQVGAILNFGTQGVLCVMQDKASGAHTTPLVIASTGESTHLHEQETLPSDHPWADAISQTFREKRSLFGASLNVLYIDSAHGHHFAVAFAPPWPLEEIEHGLLNVFCDRIAAAFDNLHMFETLRKTQEATVVALADLAESRDATVGGHVRRVCRLTNAIIAELQLAGKFFAELTPSFVSVAGIASILHDVGKVATPDAVLLKPGLHTPDERRIMEQHAAIGEIVLARAAQLVEGMSSLGIGAQIAGGHHEKFDGSGYPRGLKGYDIPLAARIVAVADVFDALLHVRPYKHAWPLDEVVAYMKNQRGAQFDADVVDALLAFLQKNQPDWIMEPAA